jgi:hypothetical protein
MSMLVASLFEQFAVRNVCRTGRFTGEASDAVFRVLCGPRIGWQPPIRFLAPKPKATAWRIVLIAGQLICRTDFQTKAAVNAARQKIFSAVRCHFRISHDVLYQSVKKKAESP